MKTIKANSVTVGMKLTAMVWFKQSDRRPYSVEVTSVKINKETGKVSEIDMSSNEVNITAKHNGTFMSTRDFEEKEFRVTFAIEGEIPKEVKAPTSRPIVKPDFSKNPEGHVHILRDKDGLDADWNWVDGKWQLPADQGCGSFHTPAQLGKEGYQYIGIRA